MRRLLLAMMSCGLWAVGLAAEVRDPMRPPERRVGHQAVTTGAPVLSALFIGATRRAAIVNGRLVHEGDRLGDYTIVALLDDGIRYQSRGELHEQHLLANELHVKKPAASVARAANGGS